MRRRLLSVTVLGVLCTASTAANAQGWIKMPNGSLAYVASYVTTGVFTCGNPSYILGRCLAFGNSVTLSKGSSSATITYTGANQTLVAPSRHSRALALGSLQSTFSGTGPNRFPGMYLTVARLFYLNIGITTTSPMVSTAYLSMSYATRPQGLVGYGGYYNVALLAVTPPPPPSTYGAVSVYGLNVPTLETEAEIEDLYARTSVVPEPATIALLGSGLLAVFGVARRRAKNRA